ncbi:MAG: hypothetical protein R3228_01705 [Halioglobus sp.]|nr:hypothetical protein [Halioglobus sp.]
MKKNMAMAKVACAASFILAAPGAFAGPTLGIPLSQVLGGALPADVGASLPVGLGGAAALTGLGLIVGAQLIKRRNKRNDEE